MCSAIFTCFIANSQLCGRGVVTLRYCDWSDGQIKVVHKTLLEPHIVTMYRLWDGRPRAVKSTAHIFSHSVGVKKHEARQTLWNMYLKSQPTYMKSRWQLIWEMCLFLSVAALTGCLYVHVYFVQFYCSFFLHLTLWWDCGLLTSVCVHDLILPIFPLIVPTWSFSLNCLYVTVRNNSVMRVETLHVPPDVQRRPSAPGMKYV